MQIQKVRPFLWFNNQAAEAAHFYCSLFPASKVLSDSGQIVEFELEGMRVLGLNGGPVFQLSESFSFFVLCEDQNEVDHLWDNLTAEGGSEGQCGWCKDRFGLSWQIVPQRFMELVQSGTSEQTQRVTQAMLRMRKMIVADLEAAFAG